MELDNYQKHLLIVGFGDLAKRVVTLLMNIDNNCKITIGCRNPKQALHEFNLIRFSALNTGNHVQTNLVHMDLDNIAKTAETIAFLKPDLIFNAASLQSWRIITQLPKAQFEALDQAQFGPWLPMHLVPVHKLMLAVKESDQAVGVVNSAFPDAVNPVLKTKGLSPLCGIGNVANIIPALRYSFAYKNFTDPNLVQVKLASHHYFSHYAPRYGESGGAPYQCWVTLDSVKDEKEQQVSLDDVLPLLKSRFKRTGGLNGQLLTASSAVSILRGLFSNIPIHAHSPGPYGLPGGYPVLLKNLEVQIETPGESDITDLVHTNTLCQRFDGIEKITETGTVHFGEGQMEIMKSMLGFYHESMTLEDAPEMAKELGSKYTEFARKYQSA